MVILKNSYKLKIKASTIVETLIASIIIVIIFSIASMTLNNLFKSNITKNTITIETHLIKLQYLQENNKLVTPYYEDYKSWSISIKEINIDHKRSVIIEALKGEKQLTKTISNAGY